MKYFKILATASFLLLATSLPAFSQEVSRTFTIIPPTVEFRANQNDKLETKLKVRNETDEPITFTLTVRDFIVEDNQGTPKILPPDTAGIRWAASKWMMVDPDTLTVPGRSVGEAMLYIQIPGDATFGGHYAAVIFEPTVVAGGVSGAGAAIITQSASLVYLYVQGPIKESAEVIKFLGPKFSEYGPIKIETEIKNLGDLHIKPVGTIEIKDLFGKTLESLPLKENNIFPGASRVYENSWEKKWLAGKFSANLAATYGQNGLPLTAVFVFYVFPWRVTLVIVLFILILVLLAKYIQRKNNPPPPKFSQEK